MDNKIQRLVIAPDATIKAALTQMDTEGYKLLIIADEQSYFKGLITIGDIQRAIIANKSFSEKVIHLSRADIIVGKINDPKEEVKKQMLKYRLVYMPLIDAENKLADVIYWNDIFDGESNLEYPKLNMPVVIMAGGFGTRLKPLTNILPKPLLPFGETTILENIIDRFKKYNCRDFQISVNYKADLIKFYFDSINNKDYDINLFTESKPLGTAGSLHLLDDKLNNTFFVSNCDILIDDDYAAMYNYHKEHSNELTLIASVKNFNIPYGTIESGENGELLSLKEKPQLNFMINCGMYILEPHLLKEIPRDTFFHITDLIEKIKERRGKVGVYPVSEKSWIDIGEWKHYSKVLFSKLS